MLSSKTVTKHITVNLYPAKIESQLIGLEFDRNKRKQNVTLLPYYLKSYHTGRQLPVVSNSLLNVRT